MTAVNHFTFHSDDGHGWVFIDNDTMALLGLARSSFSNYSYYDDDGVYAEEDCDAGVIFKQLDVHGYSDATFTSKHHNGLHWIRNLKRC